MGYFDSPAYKLSLTAARLHKANTDLCRHRISVFSFHMQIELV